eukprot:SAG22_NODE_4638_length_1208_cov_1.201984_1_plen_196_part_00
MLRRCRLGWLLPLTSPQLPVRERRPCDDAAADRKPCRSGCAPSCLGCGACVPGLNFRSRFVDRRFAAASTRRPCSLPSPSLVSEVWFSPRCSDTARHDTAVIRRRRVSLQDGQVHKHGGCKRTDRGEKTGHAAIFHSSLLPFFGAPAACPSRRPQTRCSPPRRSQRCRARQKTAGHRRSASGCSGATAHARTPQS